MARNDGVNRRYRLISGEFGLLNPSRVHVVGTRHLDEGPRFHVFRGCFVVKSCHTFAEAISRADKEARRAR